MDIEEEVKTGVLTKTGLPLDAADPTGQGGNSNKGISLIMRKKKEFKWERILIYNY